MKTNNSLILSGFVFCLFLSACGQKVTIEEQATTVRLFDIFEAEDLIGKITPDNAGWKRIEWSAEEMAPWQPPAKAEDGGVQESPKPAPNLGFRALNDLDVIKIDQGGLQGTIAGPAPVLHFALGKNRGGADAVKFVEVSMRVTGSKHVWLRSQGEETVDDAALVDWASKSDSWNGSVEVVDGQVHTYRFEVSSAGSGRGGRGGPGVRGGPGGNRGGPPNGAGFPLPDGGGFRPPPDGGFVPPDGAGFGPPQGDGGFGQRGGRGFGRRGGGGFGPPGGGGFPGGFPFPSGGDAGRQDLRHFSLTFRDCGAGAGFAVESVRLVSEKEVKLAEPSGQQWAGLSEIFRETLATKTSETIRMSLRDLPQRPWLDLAIGTTERTPVTFVVSIANRGESEGSESKALMERTVTIPNRWQTLRVDLAAYAGKSVVMKLALKGETKGLWGFWGAPTIRSSLATVQQPIAGTSSKKARRPRGVIFLVIDTLRRDHLNIYGYERETLVHLKKFADEGVAFANAIAQGTMTKISQPSMVTSLYPVSHTVLGMDRGLPASAVTIAEAYREAGYATVSYSSVPFTGKSNNMHQGYEELHESGSISDTEYRTKTSQHYVDRLIQWLEEHQDTQFFAFLHVFDPHSPFRPRPPYDTIWGAPGTEERMAKIEEDIRASNVRTAMDNMPHKDEYLKTGNDPDELLRIYKDWYDGSIRGADAEIGRLFQALREMGLEDDTLIVFSSDHGEELWDHGQFFHGQSVYGELSQVPLVFRWPNNPGIQKGVMVDHVVENVDIMPTLLELSGIEGPSNMQGRSLVPLLDGSGNAAWKKRVAVTQAMVGGPMGGGGRGGGGQKPHFGIIEEGWKLVSKEIDPDPVKELFHREDDPLDQKNLIESEGQGERARAIGKTFEEWKSKMEAAKLPSDEEMSKELTSDELRRLQALGYVGGGVQTKGSDDSKDQSNKKDADKP
ncbi:MAG: sulfatase [Verrucomicrobia bacterium]|nr:sulfatase [Verrucomicrobiota bacterium]